MTDTKFHVRRLLEEIGDNPNREGLAETPQRMEKAFKHLYRGYKPHDFVMKTFSSNYTGIVARVKIPVFSHCEHHGQTVRCIMDFAYMPEGKVLGASKIIRFLRHYSAKLTIQEDLTDNLLDKFVELVKPKGAMLRIIAYHECEEARGIEVQGVPMLSQSVRGIFLDGNLRFEVLDMWRAGREVS